MKHEPCGVDHLKHLVPRKGTCEVLKRLGFPQNTALSWMEDDYDYGFLGVNVGSRPYDHEYAAPTAQELQGEIARRWGAARTQTLNAGGGQVTWKVCIPASNVYDRYGGRIDEASFGGVRWYTSERQAEALAAVFIEASTKDQREQP